MKAPTNYPLDAVLPVIARRVRLGDFATNREIAKAYGVEKTTVINWRHRAAAMGLITHFDWRLGMLRGKFARASEPSLDNAQAA